MCDIFSHPLHHQDTNHDWVIDFWLPKSIYKIEKATNNITKDEEIYSYLPDKPYSNLNNERTELISNYLKNNLNHIDLVIAFECKPETRNILNKIHKNIVYAFFSPLRYSDRLTFALTSNNEEFQKKIEIAHKKALQYYQNQASYVSHFINNNTTKLDIPENSTLLIGQVEQDLAVWNGKDYLNLDQYFDDIEKKSTNSTLLYKAHPFAPDNNLKIRTNKNVTIVDAEIYQLLASEKVKKVITVSSSVAKEAFFFEKKVTQYFSGYITEKTKSIPYTQDPKFWNYLLDKSNDLFTTEFNIDAIDIRPIRKTYWGYSYISNLKFTQSTELKEFKKKYLFIKKPKFMISKKR